MRLRETPLKYDGAMATLEMEFRVSSADLPASASDRWLNVEVQTSKINSPAGTFRIEAQSVNGNDMLDDSRTGTPGGSFAGNRCAAGGPTSNAQPAASS